MSPLVAVTRFVGFIRQIDRPTNDIRFAVVMIHDLFVAKQSHSRERSIVIVVPVSRLIISRRDKFSLAARFSSRHFRSFRVLLHPNFPENRVPEVRRECPAKRPDARDGQEMVLESPREFTLCYPQVSTLRHYYGVLRAAVPRHYFYYLTT